MTVCNILVCVVLCERAASWGSNFLSVSIHMCVSRYNHKGPVTAALPASLSVFTVTVHDQSTGSVFCPALSSDPRRW